MREFVAHRVSEFAGELIKGSKPTVPRRSLTSAVSGPLPGEKGATNLTDLVWNVCAKALGRCAVASDKRKG